MSTTKDRIIDVSGALFRQQGYAGTGLKQILAGARAPFGSLYHFFPGGKAELGEATILAMGRTYLALIDQGFEGRTDLAAAVEDFFSAAAAHLEATGYEDACPIGTLALEVASTSEPLRQATATVFESWIAATARHFESAGLSLDQARDLAIGTLAALEGAFMLSRAARSLTPMRIAGRMAAALARDVQSRSLCQRP